MHICGSSDSTLISESPFKCDYPIKVEVVATSHEEPFSENILVMLYALFLKDMFGDDGAGTPQITEASLLEDYPLSERWFVI